MILNKNICTYLLISFSLLNKQSFTSDDDAKLKNNLINALELSVSLTQKKTPIDTTKIEKTLNDLKLEA